MMHRVKTICLALIAMFALCVVASASASAAELPEFTVETAGTVTNGEVEFTSKGGEIKCAKSTGSTTEGLTQSTYTISFKTCVELTLGEGSECHSLGDPSGTILTGGTWRLVGGRGNTSIWAMAPSELHIECKNKSGTTMLLMLLQGDVAGSITPRGVRTGRFSIRVSTKGEAKIEQEDPGYENDEGKEVGAKLEWSIDSKSLEPVGDNAGEIELATEKETEIVK